jgi:hypothetical protein
MGPVEQSSDCLPASSSIFINRERPSRVLGSVGAHCYVWSHTFVTLLFCYLRSKKEHRP